MADVGLLLVLAVLALVWWLHGAVWELAGVQGTVQWRDWLMLWPAMVLVLRGMAVARVDREDREARQGLFRYRWVQRGVLLYATFAVIMPLAETFLRRVNVDIRIAPLLLATRQAGIVRYHEDMIRDAELLWKFEPGAWVYGQRINRLGFRDREVAARKPAGTKRVICLGDSVTAQGQPGYARYLNERLIRESPDGARWEAFSMGVYGYSSQQGLRLFETVGRALKPDVVTISFGRNDHNVADVPDRVRMGCRLPRIAKVFYEVLRYRRVGRLLLHAVDTRHRWTEVREPSGLRVAPEAFRENMRAFVREVRAAGAIPILVTAPRRAIPRSYVESGYARTTGEFERQHDAYAQIVRDVARETGATLVDMQRLMASPECDAYFAPDAIHFDFYEAEPEMRCGEKEQPGLRRYAEELYAAIRAVTAGVAAAPGPR